MEACEMSARNTASCDTWSSPWSISTKKRIRQIGADTVHPGVGDHLPGGDGESVHLIIAPEPRILADAGPHDEEDGRHDQAELDDEGVEVGRGLGDDVAHQVDAAAREVVELVHAGDAVLAAVPRRAELVLG